MEKLGSMTFSVFRNADGEIEVNIDATIAPQLDEMRLAMSLLELAQAVNLQNRICDDVARFFTFLRDPDDEEERHVRVGAMNGWSRK